MKKKALSYYLDLMKSTQDKKDWIKKSQYGESAVKKLSSFSCSNSEKYQLYSNLGNTYGHLAKYSRALDMNYSAYLIASKYKFPPEQIAHSACMIGLNLLDMDRLSQAITQFRKVEEYYQKYGDNLSPMTKEVYCIILVGLGACYLYKGELEKVEEIIQKKLSPYQSIIKDLNHYYRLKGDYLIKRKEYVQAREVFQKLIEINKCRNSQYPICVGQISLVVIDLLEGNLESAINSLKSLFKDKHYSQFNDLKCGIGLLLSKCYELKNLPAKARIIEAHIKPLLSKLDIDWFYATSRDIEQLNQELQAIYNSAVNPVPPILTNTIHQHYEKSDYKYLIIGKSNPMIEVYQLIEKIAPTDLPILIQGETGTGKELVAWAIHHNSLRNKNKWLALNCGAVPESLLESELFGHSRGAFTDAHREQKGYIELASEGTLFLDEIADMSPAMQQKLLRILGEKLVWRLGAEKPIPVNTRFILASNQNIEELVNNKRFRLDLFHRINPITITLPPLRDRRDDIPLLINHFLVKYSVSAKSAPTIVGTPLRSEIRSSKSEIEVTPDALRLLTVYPWPGNVRELENEIKRVCALYPQAKLITELMLSEIIRKYQPDTSSKVINKGNLTLTELRREFERNVITETIKKCKGNISLSARLLGFKRTDLYKKMNNLRINTKSMPNITNR
jgi:DNA-binding NtrC family response regulator